MPPASRPVHSAGLRNLLLSKDESIKVPATCPYCEKHFPNLKDHFLLNRNESVKLMITQLFLIRRKVLKHKYTERPQNTEHFWCLSFSATA